MQIDSKDIVSATEVNRNISRFITEASDGRTFVVMKDNKAAACIVGPEAMERLQCVEERERDLKLLALTLVRVGTDSGERHSLDDVIAELGIDED
ncbi:type II toxin-antitoxin system Phd/YefM family antitoxin [Rhodococcus sp. C3V]|uniref:type II toxin-antitoxin system Phd/YefM family antitoxin n=1 Tax=Rhodococcus sp. C3V TaxID=3034165 RepID=UPI0023E14903|nr:type II toxin-antitoxin system Phd/YefM family antitoxin [Rhodococcus sp. C3V]MDF3316492.1 type II toxin-antitoxin system Phd/YefM family antitoxin [Rhodococcus sp. C3V]